MKIKVIKEAWYNNTLYNPDLGDIFIEYAGEKVPSWGELVDEVEEAQPEEKQEELIKVEWKNDESEETETENESDNVKVGDLPLVQRNSLIAEATALKITGNLLGFKVSTLKSKIEKAKENKGE